MPPDPLGTVAEPDGEFVDEVQAQIIGPTCIQLLEDLYNLRTQEVMKHIKTGYTKAVHWSKKGLSVNTTFSISIDNWTNSRTEEQKNMRLRVEKLSAYELTIAAKHEHLRLPDNI